MLVNSKGKSRKTALSPREPSKSFFPSPLLHFLTEINQTLKRGEKLSFFYLIIFFFWNSVLMFSKEFTIIFNRGLENDRMIWALTDILKVFDISDLRANFVVLPLLIIIFFVLSVSFMGGVYFLVSLKIQGEKLKSSIWPRVFGSLFSSYFWVFFIPVSSLNLKSFRCFANSIKTNEQSALMLEKFEFCETDINSLATIFLAISFANVAISVFYGAVSCIFIFKIFANGYKDYMRRMQFSFNVLLFIFTCFLVIYKLIHGFPNLETNMEISRYILIPFLSLFCLSNILRNLPFFEREINLYFIVLLFIWSLVTFIQILMHILSASGINNKIYSSLLYLFGIPFVVKLAYNVEMSNHILAMSSLKNPKDNINKAKVIYAFSNLVLENLFCDGNCLNNDKNLISLGFLFELKEDTIFKFVGRSRSSLSEKQQRRILIEEWKIRISQFRKKVLNIDWEKRGVTSSKELSLIYTYKSLYLLTEVKNYAKSYYFFRKSYDRASKMGDLSKKLLNVQMKYAFKTVFSQNLTEMIAETGAKLNLEKFFELERNVEVLKEEIRGLIELHFDFWKEQSKLEPEVRQLINKATKSKIYKKKIDEIYSKIEDVDSEYSLYKNHVGIIYGVYKLYLDFDYLKGMQLIEYNYKQSFIKYKSPRKLGDNPYDNDLHLKNKDEEGIDLEELREAVLVKARYEDNDLKKIVGVSKNSLEAFGFHHMQIQEGGLEFILPSMFIKNHKERSRRVMIESSEGSSKKKTYYTLAKHASGHLFPIKKQLRISPDIDNGFHFLSLLIPNRKEFGISFFLCDGDGIIDSCSFGLLKILNIANNGEQKKNQSINEYSKNIGSIIRLLQIDRELDEFSPQISQADNARIQKLMFLNKRTEIFFENGKYDKELVSELAKKATNDGFIVEFSVPKSKRSNCRTSVTPNLSKEKLLKILNLDTQTYKQSLSSMELTNNLVEGGEDSSCSEDKVYLACKIEQYTFFNKNIILVIKLRSPGTINSRSDTQKKEFLSTKHIVTIENNYLEEKNFVEIDKNDWEEVCIADDNEASETMKKPVNSVPKRNAIEIPFEKNSSEEHNNAGQLPMKDKFYSFHQSQNTKELQSEQGGESSSLQNSSSSGKLLKKSRALYMTIRKPFYPRLFSIYLIMQIAFISIQVTIVAIGYDSNKDIFLDAENLAEIVKESENRQTAVMDLFRRSITIKNYITGFGSPYRNLTIPTLNQINNYTYYLGSRVKNFLSSEIFLKNSLNKRQEAEILEYENQEFDIHRFSGNTSWIDKTDFFQFSKILAEAGTRVSNGNYTLITSNEERFNSLLFMEANLLDSPLHISQLLAKKIFTYMLNQLDIHRNIYLKLFYVSTSLLAVFFICLAIISTLYLNIKNKQASLLILCEPRDVELQKAKLSEMIKLFSNGKGDDIAAKDQVFGPIKGKYESADENTNTRYNKQINELLKYSNHRRNKSLNKKGLSLHFNLILVACLSSMLYLLIFRLVNYSAIVNNYQITFILTNRMRVVFERSYLHNILGVSLIGMINKESLTIFNKPAEEEFRLSLNLMQTQNTIYEAFLKNKDDDTDHTFEDFNTLNFCFLFPQNPCFDPELIGNGWISFENSYVNIVNNIYFQYLDRKGNRTRLENLYDSYQFLYLDAALSRGRIVHDYIRFLTSDELFDRIRFTLNSLYSSFIISIFAFVFYLAILIFKQSGYIKTTFVNIRYVFSLFPPETLMKNKILMNYFINTTSNQTLKRIFKNI